MRTRERVPLQRNFSTDIVPVSTHAYQHQSRVDWNVIGAYGLEGKFQLGADECRLDRDASEEPKLWTGAQTRYTTALVYCCISHYVECGACIESPGLPVVDVTCVAGNGGSIEDLSSSTLIVCERCRVFNTSHTQHLFHQVHFSNNPYSERYGNASMVLLSLSVLQ